MGPKKFNSQIKLLGQFGEGLTDIKNEPMFFNCAPLFAYQNGGPITQAFLNALPKDWCGDDTVFDSRVHMLMPGWYPAIPGFHHDDVPRPEIPPGQHFITAGQPDYENPRYRSEHILGLVNGDICPTVFALGKCVMPAVDEGELIYRKWHLEVERLLKSGELEHYSAPSNLLVYFDCDTFHSGVKATGSGWRWFGRISRHTDRVNKITNEIRNQVQVYLEFPMEGW